MSDDLKIYEAMYHDAPDMQLSVDPTSGTLVRCNRRLLNSLGYSKDEIIGRKVAELYHPDDLPKVKENLAAFKATGKVKHHELRVSRKDGAYVDVSLSFSPVKDEAGNVIYSNAVWRDISEIKAARRQIDFERSKYQDLYEHAPDMFLSVDPKTGKVLDCNLTLCNELGYTREEVLDKPLIKHYHPDDLPLVKENLEHFKKTGFIKNEELRVLRKDGSFVEVSLKTTPVKDEAGNNLYSRAVWRDITELKEAQRNLEQEKAKTEELLLNILPKSIVEELKQNDSSKPQLFESATVLFTDFAGFSKTAGQMKPAQLVAQLDRYFSAFDRIVEKFGLEKLKTIGDAYMCVGGLPLPDNDHAWSVCQAALEMHKAVDEINRSADGVTWRLRVGINTGPVIAGVIGKKKFAYDIWGDAVNLAARLESSGEPEKVNVSESTYQLIKDRISCEARGTLAVKNMGEVPMYFLGSS